jgi:hypothetical protein
MQPSPPCPPCEPLPPWHAPQASDGGRGKHGAASHVGGGPVGGPSPLKHGLEWLQAELESLRNDDDETEHETIDLKGLTLGGKPPDGFLIIRQSVTLLNGTLDLPRWGLCRSPPPPFHTHTYTHTHTHTGISCVL